jgi:hypothetical protein
MSKPHMYEAMRDYPDAMLKKEVKRTEDGIKACTALLDELHAEKARLLVELFVQEIPYQHLVMDALNKDLDGRIERAGVSFKAHVVDYYKATSELKRRGLS